MVSKRSMRDRPTRSMAQAMTTSNLPATGIEHGVEPWPLVPALGTADASILVDLDDLPDAALCDRPKLADPVLDGLRISRDPHVERGSLWFGHGRPRIGLRPRTEIGTKYDLFVRN